MIDPHWVFLSAALGLAGCVRYAFATLAGSARPNLVTWSLWAAAPLIGFFAQVDAGVGLPAVTTLAAGVGPLVVVVSGLVGRHHRARLGAFDVACGAVAVLALAVWLGLGQAPLAVFVAVAADAIAALPTIRKAWHDPDSENVLFYVLVGVGATITLFTISSWEPEAWAFAAYMLVLCVVLIAVVSGRRHARHVRHTGGMAGPPLPERLEGDGVTLRLLRESDWPLEQALSRDADAVRWTTIEADLDEDGARERVRRRVDHAVAGTGQRWVIETGGEPHGTVGLAVTGTVGVELFYGLLPASRGKGLVTRAVGLVVGAAREAGFTTIVLATFPDNRASRATAARCGFVETGTRTITVKDVPQELDVWTLPGDQDA